MIVNVISNADSPTFQAPEPIQWTGSTPTRRLGPVYDANPAGSRDKGGNSCRIVVAVRRLPRHAPSRWYHCPPVSVRRSCTVPSRVWRQRLGRDTGFGASTQVSLATPSRARSIAVRTFPVVRPIPVTGMMLRTLKARNAEEFESIYQYKRPLLLTAPNAVDLDAWQASTQRLLAQPQPV